MRLITKTLLYYLLVSLPLMGIAGFCSYFLIKAELTDSTEEAMYKEFNSAKNTINQFDTPKNYSLSSDNLSRIEIVSNFSKEVSISDTIIYDKQEEENLNHHVLKAYYANKGTNYLITISKTTLEEDDLLESLLSSFAIILVFILVSLFIVNWFVSKSLWKPFYKTVSKLNQYDVKQQTQERFEDTSITEFNQLNTSLNKMIDKIQSDFLTQKEFIDNASHEMQTPLAVLKNNVDLLMQSENLKEHEMNQLQSIENTIKKLSSLNKSLLLLTKIENRQFKDDERVSIITVLDKSLVNYTTTLELKGIDVKRVLVNDCIVDMNLSLAEILINNLLQNAIRYNNSSRMIEINLDKNSLAFSNSGDELKMKKEDLFVRFKKNDSSQESIGLGLSIVKGICDLYNFQINYHFVNGMHIFTIKF